MDDYFIISCRHCNTKNKLLKDKAISNFKNVVCGNCKKNLFISHDEVFANISSSSYEHSLDRQALNALKKVPGVKTLLKWVLKETVERYWRVFQFQNFIRVTETHLEKYHEMLVNACNILDINPIPQTFIYQDPKPNAYTIGVEEPTIAISSGLIDLLEDDEILGVISHELGHIQAGHILYKTAALILTQVLDILADALFGLGNLAILPIMSALFYWERCAELTSDRAIMIVLRDFDKSANIIAKLAGGSQKIIKQIKISEFLKQADEATKMKEENFINKIFILLQTMDKSHPFPIWRAGHLHKWAKSDELVSILQGNYKSNSDEDKKNHNSEFEGGDTKEEESNVNKIMNKIKDMFNL